MSKTATMRLLCVSHYFESHRGGIEMAAGQLARSLGSRMSVTWAASDASPAPTDIAALPLRASNIIERRSGLPFPLPVAGAIGRLVRAVKASDAVLVHDGMYPTSIAAIIAARLFRRPVVLVQHIGHVPGPSPILTALFTIADRFLTRPMLRLASQAVFISDTTARHFGRSPTKSKPALIFNGVDDKIFLPCRSEKERKSERATIGWPADRPVALFVGRFIEKKGLLRLREMAAKRPNVHWAFAGWGPCDPADWDLPNVSVHRGLSGVGLAQLYRSAELLILPSKSEGFPLVVQEALACGLRAICCEDGAKGDPAAEAYIASVPRTGTEAQIVEAYLAQVDRLTSMADGASDRAARADFARRRYSLEAGAQHYFELLSSLTQRPRPLVATVRATA